MRARRTYTVPWLRIGRLRALAGAPASVAHALISSGRETQAGACVLPCMPPLQVRQVGSQSVQAPLTLSNGRQKGYVQLQLTWRRAAAQVRIK